VRGGTVGLVRPLAVGEGRDWAQAADQFCAQYDYWINIADADDSDETADNEWDIDPLKKGGPTSVRIARRNSGSMTFPWFSYPPYWDRGY